MTHISEENEKRETKERERTPVALLRDEPRRFHSVRSVGGTAAANCHQHQVTAQSRGLGRRWGAAGGPRGPGTAAPAPPARAAAAIPARAARGRLAGRGGVRGGGCATGRLRPGEDKRLGAPSGRQPPAAGTAARSGRSALPFPHGHGRGGGAPSAGRSRSARTAAEHPSQNGTQSRRRRCSHPAGAAAGGAGAAQGGAGGAARRRSPGQRRTAPHSAAPHGTPRRSAHPHGPAADKARGRHWAVRPTLRRCPRGAANGLPAMQSGGYKTGGAGRGAARGRGGARRDGAVLPARQGPRAAGRFGRRGQEGERRARSGAGRMGRAC